MNVERLRNMSLFNVALALVVWLTLLVPAGEAQIAPTTFFLGFSPKLPPTDSLVFRQAIAYAIDREAVVKAVSPHTQALFRPALTIQHPQLPGFNPSARGYSFDPARAKELYTQSGWVARITILVGPAPATSKFLEALHGAVADSIRNTLGNPVAVQRVANFDALVRAARSQIAPIWMYGWLSDREDFAYPSFALALAHGYFERDADVKNLVEKGDAQAVEQALLDKALIIPIIYH